MSCITYTIINKYYQGEPGNIHIQSLIDTIQENNWVITTKKKGRGKLPLFRGNGERVIPIYGSCYVASFSNTFMHNHSGIYTSTGSFFLDDGLSFTNI